MPPCAASILPAVVLIAPVNAPFSCPNSSLSSSVSGIAAQLIATNAPLARGLASCSPRASSSLPVPDAPSSSTDTSAGATRSMVRVTLSISGAAVSMPPSAVSPSIRAARRRFSASSAWTWNARATISPSVSMSIGLE